MLGNHRYLFENYLDDATITPSNQLPGIVSGVQHQNIGSAIMVATGSYTNDAALLYTVIIHDISGGTEVGQAKYRWRTNETTIGQWEASNIVTSLTDQALNNAVSIHFLAGTGDDFALNDTFQFRAFPTWGTTHLTDWKRETFWSSETIPATLTIDCGEERQITALIFHDHNTPSIFLQGNSTNTWTDPAYAASFITSTDPFILYLDKSYRYWQVTVFAHPVQSTILDINSIPFEINTEEFEIIGLASQIYEDITAWKIGSLYLGSYLELSGNASPGSSIDHRWNILENINPAGVFSGYALTTQKQYALNYNNSDNTEVEQILDVFEYAFTTTTGQIRPFFFHFHHDEDDTLMMARIDPELSQTRNGPDSNSFKLVLNEVVKH